MKSISLCLAAALALALVAGSRAQTPAGGLSPSLIRAGVTEKLTEHVWAIPDGSAPAAPNVGIVVGTRAVLVVDTGMGARNAHTILAEVAKVAAGKPIYLVTTHYHPEHDLGAHAFPAGSKLIRSKDQEADIAQYGLALANTFASRSPINAELLKDVQYRKADITFDKTYVVDLGGVIVRIVAVGPNHTRGDTVAFVEPDRVLFSGDVAMRGQPAFAAPESSLKHWLVALDELERFGPLHVVPAHGPRGDVEMIRGYRTYLTRIQTRAAALKAAGKTQDETVAAINEEMGGQYPDRNRLGGAIRNAYAEAR
jgi:glyoxylase-like metal-dependent hydrolase (beta-lactamase superfamily II)